MDVKMKSIRVAALSAVILVISQHSAAYPCSVDDFLLTKEGSLAAATPQELHRVTSLVTDNKANLTELAKHGAVLELKGGVKVQVLERSVEWKMLKIKFPDDNKTYWVKDGALTPVNGAHAMKGNVRP